MKYIGWMEEFNLKDRKNLGPNEIFGDGGNGTYFIGTKGKMMCGTYGADPKLLPTSRTNEVQVKQKYPQNTFGSMKAIMHNG